MGAESEFEYSEKTSCANIADYCEKLADGFRRKGFELHGKGHSITLTPDDTVKLEVKAKCEGPKGSLQIEISWKKEADSSGDRLQVVTDGNAAVEKA